MKENRITVDYPREKGHYAVIHSSSLAGKVSGENDKDFWGGYGYHRPLSDYQTLILDSQDYIKKVISGELRADDPNYYIYGTKNILELRGKTVYKVSDTAFQACTWVTDPIYVYKDGNVFRSLNVGGKHRFAAARGMDCYIIAFVDGEY